MEEYNFQLPKNLNGLRLDKALAELTTNNSRSQIQKIIKNSGVMINNVIINDAATKVKENDIISFSYPELKSSVIIQSNIKLDILYEDNDLMVINKATGMTVHPGAGNHQDTLVNALLYHANSLSTIGGFERPGIVHRLDKDTSGLMVVAKNNYAHISLAKQIEKRHLIRKYKALIWGVINNAQEGIIKNNIGRSYIDRKKMTILKFGGKEAITHYKTLSIFYNGLISMIECKLETGRTHQIRVQLSHLQHSIIGDQVYGNNKKKINNCPIELQIELIKCKHQLLHSYYISFKHPVTQQLLEFEIKLPHYIEKVVNILK